ncbi:acyl-n-acyltransferase [Colletotrichum plurivorum]|uniref:Acyl-n-acyltransferase n=1 Tax=Colletotrichum plurivorum TaxID=2175906 RepID=A0A8H6KW58_9PEZI|nr:acyl-n-acyltransferase [Colletotrichum plurivorum]
MASVGRPMAPSIQALQEESVIQEQFQPDEWENNSSSTHLGGDPASPLPPHLAHRAVAPTPDPLTCEVLDSLGEKHGHVAQSKKSHHSWDISEGEDDVSGNEGSSNHIDYHPQFGFASWILHWVNCLPSEPATVNLQGSDEHVFRHDINPETGEFMAYIDQPDTWTNFEEEKKLEAGALRRRREWTSNFIVRRERAARENLERRVQEAKEREYKRTVVKQIQQLAVEPSTAGTQIKATRSANGVMPAESNNSGVMSSMAPKTRSVAGLELRLGFLSDAQDCAAIYNLAVSAHAPLPDNHPISSQRFEFIFNECLRQKLPFVVAVAKKADLTDAKNWPSLDAYRQYMQWRQSQPEEESATSTIYGFAFLSPYERGLGLGSGAAAETVKATVFVHPDHRRHGVGSALLDRLLVETSILYHGGDIQYEWKEPDTQDAFERSSFRQVHRIIMHVMVDGDRKNPNWMNSFMKSFQFEKAGRLNQVYKVVTPHTVEWYDQVIWIHWAKKISNGPVCDAGEESECSYDYPGKSRAQFAQSVYQV